MQLSPRPEPKRIGLQLFLANDSVLSFPNTKMKFSKILFSLAAAGVLTFGLMAADPAKSAAPAGTKGGCCVKAEKDGKTCAHPCCVEAAKAHKNCEKCGGTNTAKPAA